MVLQVCHFLHIPLCGLKFRRFFFLITLCAILKGDNHWLCLCCSAVFVVNVIGSLGRTNVVCTCYTPKFSNVFVTVLILD